MKINKEFFRNLKKTDEGYIFNGDIVTDEELIITLPSNGDTLIVTGNISVNDYIDVEEGSLVCHGNLEAVEFINVEGNLEVFGNINVTHDITVQGSIKVGGSISANTIEVEDYIKVKGNVKLRGYLNALWGIHIDGYIKANTFIATTYKNIKAKGIIAGSFICSGVDGTSGCISDDSSEIHVEEYLIADEILVGHNVINKGIIVCDKLTINGEERNPKDFEKSITNYFDKVTKDINSLADFVSSVAYQCTTNIQCNQSCYGCKEYFCDENSCKTFLESEVQGDEW